MARWNMPSVRFSPSWMALIQMQSWVVDGNWWTGAVSISVWKSGPVSSFAYFRKTGLLISQNLKKPDRTALTGLNQSFKYFCIGRKFWIDLSFILSPRTSEMVYNSQRYEGFQKFYPFLTILDKYLNISVSFSSICMVFSCFWRDN